MPSKNPIVWIYNSLYLHQEEGSTTLSSRCKYQSYMFLFVFILLKRFINYSIHIKKYELIVSVLKKKNFFLLGFY